MSHFFFLRLPLQDVSSIQTQPFRIKERIYYYFKRILFKKLQQSQNLKYNIKLKINYYDYENHEIGYLICQSYTISHLSAKIYKLN